MVAAIDPARSSPSTRDASSTTTSRSPELSCDTTVAGRVCSGPRVERLDLGVGQHSGARTLERARVVEQVELGERRLARDRRGGRRG